MGLIRAWRERTRTLRGAELTEYESFWSEWHAKYDRFATRDRAHFLNSINTDRAICICNAIFTNGTEEELLTVFREHLDVNEPMTVDVGAILASRNA